MYDSMPSFILLLPTLSEIDNGVSLFSHSIALTGTSISLALLLRSWRRNLLVLFVVGVLSTALL